MRYNREIHHRRSIRLEGYDYASNGAYFVTLCLQHKACLFGQVAGAEVLLKKAGNMIDDWWRKLPEKFPHTRLDQFTIMPNHFHAIIWIVGADPCVRPGFEPDPCVRPGLKVDADDQAEQADPGKNAEKGGHAGPPLPEIVQWFKTMTTNAYIRAVKDNLWPPFPGRLWQRNYYERIIRNDDELHHARSYIEVNPARWAMDRENPANHP